VTSVQRLFAERIFDAHVEAELEAMASVDKVFDARVQ